MDIAGLNFAVDTEQLKQATVRLKEMAPVASAAERAAQKWGLATKEAGRTGEDFSKRVQRTIRDLEFERQQLMRTAAEKQRYAALQRAGVAEYSAEGRAIVASVAALQAQRAALASSSKPIAGVAEVSASARHGIGMLTRMFGPLAAVVAAVSPVVATWVAGMKAADFGEQAEQIGVTTDQLQAYRFAGAQAGIEAEQMDTALTRLAKTMGAAADGGKEQIELFDKLGVKILDANGELRPVAEVLPEVARGVLNIGSSSQRTATLMELFGRSGAKMSTVLEEIAKGNDSVIAKARAAGVVLDTEVIAAWDAVSDSLTRAKLAADSTFAKLGAPIATSALEAIEKLLKSINGVMDQINSKEGFWASVLDESRRNGRIGSGPGALRLETPEEAAARRRAELEKQLKDPRNAGREGMILEDLNRLNAQGIVAAQYYAEDAAAGGKFGPKAPAIAALGDRNPTPKGGGTDPYAKAIESAKEYVLTKQAEIKAIGQNVLEAARLKHEQELLNKAMGDGKTITEAQKAALQGLAQQMAEADANLASAKFVDDISTRGQEFIAAQQFERDSLFLSTEAAAALRFEQEMLNQARQAGIDQMPGVVDAIRQQAEAMASAQEKTRKLTEIVNLGKDVTKGFFADVRQGLMEGQSLWDSFGNAALNALNKIADKLFEMAADRTASFLFDLLGSAISGALGGMGGGGGIDIGPGTGYTYAKGGVFSRGDVIPFARGAIFHAGNEMRFATGGAIVNRPTTFPMAGGRRGLMGEAGPEAILPLHRGSDGGLGVRMSGRRGGGGQENGQQVIITVTGDTDLVRVTARDEAGRAVAVATPGIVKQSVKKAGEQAPAVMARHEAQGGGEWR